MATAHVENPDLIVTFVIVGQGDSIWASSCEGQNYLVDAGRPEQAARVVGILAGHAPDGLDAVIATHPDSDPVGGLAEVIQTYAVGQFVSTGATSTGTGDKRLATAGASAGVPTVVPTVGSVLDIGCSLVVEVLRNARAAGSCAGTPGRAHGAVCSPSYSRSHSVWTHTGYSTPNG